MLIRNILEESVRKFDEVKAVKWLKKKEIMERSYGELMENVVSTRKGLLAEGFEGKHIALIGTSSVEWMESYLGIITGCTTAVPLDAALPCEDLIDLLNRSDSVALFLSPKLKPYLDAFLENCPKLQKVWMLQEEVEDAPAKVYGIGELRNAGKSASADSVCPDEEDIATIIFTSGKNIKVLGILNPLSCYCHDTVHNRFSKDNGFINSNYGIYVVNYASCICRKHGRVDLSVCDSFDQETLTTLWVLGHQLCYFNTWNIFYHFFQFRNTVRLVILNTDISLRIVKELQHNS